MIIEVRRCVALLEGLVALIEESRLEGLKFLSRLRDEWESGENRFDGSFEQLLALYVDGDLAGVGGLNRDPYSAAADTGRLRRLYIGTAYRKRGFGRLLVTSLETAAEPHFRKLVLFTDSPAASSFYQALGYCIEHSDGHSHSKLLRVG